MAKEIQVYPVRAGPAQFATQKAAIEGLGGVEVPTGKGEVKRAKLLGHGDFLALFLRMRTIRPSLRQRILFGSLAQSVEQLAFNQLVAGSNPARPTTIPRVGSSHRLPIDGGH